MLSFNHVIGVFLFVLATLNQVQVSSLSKRLAFKFIFKLVEIMFATILIFKTNQTVLRPRIENLLRRLLKQQGLCFCQTLDQKNTKPCCVIFDIRDNITKSYRFFVAAPYFVVDQNISRKFRRILQEMILTTCTSAQNLR